MEYETKHALPSGFDYSETLPKTLGGSIQKRTVNVPKNGSSFLPGGVCLIDIQRSPNSVADFQNAVLRFSVTMGSNASDRGVLNSGAFNFIEQIETFHNSVPLDNIRNFYTAYQIYYDTQFDQVSRINLGDMLYGSGASIGLFDYGIPLASGKKYFFAIPLLAMLGSQTKTFWPTFDMAGFLTLRVTFAGANKAIWSAGSSASNYTIGDVEYQCLMYELSESPLKMISSPRYLIPSQGIYNWSTVFTSGTQITQLIPFRFRDLRAIYITMRRQVADSTYNYYTHVRDTYKITNYNFLINGRQFPPTRVACSTSNNLDAYTELMKAQHMSLTSTKGLGVFNFDNFNASPDPSAANPGKFMIGLDTEGFVGSNGEIEAGLDTSQSDVIFQAAFDSDISNIGAMVFDAFAIYGSQLHLEDGQMNVIY